MRRRRRRNPGDLMTFALVASGLVIILYAGKKLLAGTNSPSSPSPSPPQIPPPGVLDEPRPTVFVPGVLDA